MKKILLIAINARYSHPNLALRYLRSSVKDLPYTCIIQECTTKLGPEAITASIVRQKPDAMAFSVYIWNVELIKAILPVIKKDMPDALVIMGGPEVSYNAHDWLRQYSAIDYIIVGSGEAGFRRLLEENMDLPEPVIDIRNPPFREISFPYCDTDFQDLKNRYLYYESSRGCPYQCTYCLSSRMDQKLEYRDPGMVMEELDYLMSNNPDYIKFIDRTFNARPDISRQIWTYIIDNFSEQKTAFHFEINPALMTEQDMAVLKRCRPGLIQFEAGVQSTCDRTLRAIKRYTPWEKVKPVLRELISLAAIHLHVDLIAGLPCEGMEEFKSSFNEIYALGAHHFQLGLLKILPGTEMKEFADRTSYRYSVKAPYTVIENQWLTREDLELITLMAALVDRLYNTHHFDLTLENLQGSFHTPFDLYQALAENIRKNPNRKLSGWENSAAFILQFVQKRLPMDHHFYQDCITWDWASGAQSHRIPGLLLDQFAKKSRKKVLKLLSSGSYDIEPALITHKADLRHIDQTIVFIPHSILFKEKYLNTNSAVLFIPRKKTRIYLTIDR